MNLIKTSKKLQTIRQNLQGTVGFVPTMEYLHEGHASLVRLAKRDNDHTIVSIFVNPTQFGPNEDYERYPRNTKRDLELLRKADVDIVYMHEVKDIYPEGFSTYIDVGDITMKLEGKSRPGHFRGATTVVAKLFHKVQPTRAYFGQKDAQQVIVIKKMVDDLNFPVEIVVGETDSTRIKEAIRSLLITTAGHIDYISIADPESMEEAPITQKDALVSIAVFFGDTRLIDNFVL